MTDLNTMATLAAGLGAGFFGWLTGKANAVGKGHDATAALAAAQTKQLEILSVTVQSQAQQITALLDRLANQSSKISALSAEQDKLRSQISVSADESQSLRADLADAQADIKILQSHVDALQQQVTGLGHEPVPAPRRRHQDGTPGGT